MKPCWTVLTLAGCLAWAPAPHAADEEVAPWAESLRLNGEFLAELDRDPPSMSDVSDKIRPGENELTIEIPDLA